MENWRQSQQPLEAATGGADLPLDRPAPADLDLDLDIEKKWLNLSQVDPEQFQFFYRKYYEPIFRFVYVEVPDRETAQDITNEVFTIALEKLNRFRWQGYTFGAWLFRIAQNLKAKEKRRLARRPQINWEAESDDVEDPLHADAALLRDEEARILAEALSELEPIRQEIFRAHYWVGLKVREIAIVMDISEPSVKAHLQRGRNDLLRGMLQKGSARGLSPEKMRIVEEWTVRDEGWGLLGNDNGSPSQ